MLSGRDIQMRNSRGSERQREDLKDSFHDTAASVISIGQMIAEKMDSKVFREFHLIYWLYNGVSSLKTRNVKQ